VSLLSSPLESAHNRLSTLDEFDLQLQTAAIRERILRREKKLEVPREPSQPSELEDYAIALVSMIVEAVQSPHGDPSWTYAAFAPGFSATMAHADRESLYEGAAGTAIAIAEAGRITGRKDWLDLACNVFSPVLRGGVPACVRRGGGLGRGLGGLIYAMIRVAEAALDESLLAAAERLAIEYGPGLATSDGLDEVLYGRAGLLLAVLALNERQPSECLRDVADTAALALLRHAQPVPRGLCWPVPGGSPMPNVSHGAAGIAMSLARYARLRDDAAAAETAVKALAFDNSFWLAEEAGWIDARLEKPNGEPRTTWSWCNGRSGALLARLAVAEALGQPFQDDFIAAAMLAPADGVLRESAPGLCCGTAGAIDSLICIRDRVGVEAASSLVQQAVNVLATKTPVSNCSPLGATLFSGVAGQAFAQLRAARPLEIASIVWFS
jgi:lantibiotic modifying enzyme